MQSNNTLRSAPVLVFACLNGVALYHRAPLREAPQLRYALHLRTMAIPGTDAGNVCQRTEPSSFED